MLSRRSILGASVVAALCTCSLDAATKTWLGTDPTGPYFDIAGNWTPSGAPGTADTALFSSNSVFTVRFDNLTANPTNNVLDVEAGNVTFLHYAGNPTTYTANTLAINNAAIFQLTDLIKFVDTTGTINGGSSLIVNNLSTLQVSGALNFGTAGAATENKFLVHAGATANTAGVNVGYNAGLSARATLDGANAVWNLSSDLNVGLFGTGFVNLTAGGKVSGQNVWLGSQNGSNGTVTVANANSAFLVTKNLMIGFNSTGKGSFTTSDNAQVGIGSFGAASAFGGGFEIADYDLTGNTGGNVLIANGSTLTHNAGGPIQIAGQTNTYGRLQVSGTGSSVTTTGNIQVGLLGKGVLNLVGGGSATTSADLAAGIYSSSTGTITIGSGSVLQANGNASFGDNGGTATETISAGGRMNVGNNSSGGTNLGFFLADTHLDGTGGGHMTIHAGSTLTHSSGMTARIGGTSSYGSLTVTGANAKWISNSGGVAVAVDTNAKGFITVANGGYFETPDMTVAGFGGTGTVSVDGTGSVLKVLGNLGLSSTATAGTGIVGNSNGGVILIGDGSELREGGEDFDISDSHPIGTSGGFVRVAGGSTLTNKAVAIIGGGTGLFGKVLVTGAGSLWNAGFQVQNGVQGTGEMDVDAGGQIKGGEFFMGNSDGGVSNSTVSGGGRVDMINIYVLAYDPGTIATTTVTGTGSTIAGGNVQVGLGGNGTLNINAGGSVSTGNSDVGIQTGAVGTVTITDATSTWTSTGNLSLGSAPGTTGGSGVGHVTTAGTLNIGDRAAGEAAANFVTVSDSSSNASDGGLLSIYNGSTFTTGGISTLVVGYSSGESGRVLVSGTGSTLTVGNGFLYLGNAGSAILDIRAGGKVIEPGYQTNIGYSGGSAVITVDGNGSSFSNGNLNIGGTSGSGTLTTTAGGSLYVGNVADVAPVNGTLVINSTSSASGGLLTIAHGASLTHNGTTSIGPGTNGGLYGRMLVSSTAATSTFTANGAVTVGPKGILDIQTGGLVNVTAGGTTLASGGAINLTGGELDSNSLNISAAPSAFNFSGGKLATHTVTGQLIQNGGILAPGNTGVTDVMTISNGYTMNAGTFAMDITATNTDAISVTGAAALNGTLDIHNVAAPTTFGISTGILAATVVTGHFTMITGIALTPTTYAAITYSPTLVSFTIAHPGDATLDGHVNFDDLLILAQNYNPSLSGRIWVQGDFNGSGKTDFDDLLLLAQNYNAFGVALPADISPSFAADWALAQSLVPEPTSLAALGSIGLAARRRRR